ncbi:exonuclease A [Yersinia phage vB_YenM_TG1]|uniref:Exonuclease A n=1 Tax=Yersinia phage vB_YenM_TG1 TaxID=1589265 RepID=A0A0B5A266_9CAUD|nr:exonuclease A [Yersinia phage vB_YenM_TG1]AJD81829.1 exonuclease A [Yersinia phage vB_YenM_TG1]
MNDFLLDFETFGSTSNAAVVDLSGIPFNPDPTQLESFSELIARGKRVKFSLSSQRGKRLFSSGTIDWWKSQSTEARLNLSPSEADLDVVTGIKEFLQHLKDHGVDSWKSLGWCRGMSFDFPILTDLVREIEREKGIAEKDIDTFALEPVKFWNQRDIRTAIEAYSMVRGQTTTPLPNGTLTGFIAHDSIHDCAKDILMLKYAQRYALGIEDCPEAEDADPLSLSKPR